MSGVVEKIKQINLEKGVYENCVYKGKHNSNTWCLELFRRKVILPLIEGKIVVYKAKLVELAELLKKRKKLYSDVAEDCRKQIPYQDDVDSKILLQRERKGYMIVLNLIKEVEKRVAELTKRVGSNPAEEEN